MARKKRSSLPQSINLQGPSNLPYTMPVVRRDITLYSGDAQSLLLHFKFTSAALLRLGTVVYRRVGDKERVEDLEKHIDEEILAPLEENLRVEAKKVDLLYDAEVGKIKKTVVFTKPIKATVDLTSPGAMRILDILLDFDKLIVKLAELWFAKKITNRQYVEVQDNCRNALKESEKQIERLVRQTLNRAGESKEEATVTAEPESEPAETSETSARSGRKRRQAAEASPETEAPEQSQESEIQTITAADIAAEAEAPYTPFANIQ